MNRPLIFRIIEERSLGYLKDLIENGYNINVRDDKNRTALHLAVSNYHMSKLLVENGADLNATDLEGFKPIDFFKADLGSKENILLCDLFLSHGSDIESRNRLSKTLLHRAVCKEDYELIEFLLKKGADPNAVQKKHIGRKYYENTILCTAIDKYQEPTEEMKEIIKLLIEYGAEGRYPRS